MEFLMFANVLLMTNNNYFPLVKQFIKTSPKPRTLKNNYCKKSSKFFIPQSQ